jgi:hypothetical protein
LVNLRSALSVRLVGPDPQDHAGRVVVLPRVPVLAEFELRYDTLGLGTDRHFFQRVHRSDGSWFERPAGSYELHATHAHFHYRNFAVSELWASDEHGRRLGDEPVQDGHKNGFCVIDIENIWFGRHGDAARDYYLPQCQAPTDSGPSGPALRQGMSVGWADVYNWFLPDQYIEVSGLPDGYYLLETLADADGLVLETNEHNNSATALIRICGNAVEIVGETRSCPWATSDRCCGQGAPAGTAAN